MAASTSGSGLEKRSRKSHTTTNKHGTNSHEGTGKTPGARRSNKKSEREHGASSVEHSIGSCQADDEDELGSDHPARTEAQPNNLNDERRKRQHHRDHEENASRIYSWLQDATKSADAEHDLEGTSFNNVANPPEEIPEGVPVPPSYIQHETTNSTTPHDSSSHIEGDEKSTSDHARPQTTNVIAPAGPDALSALRDRIEPHLLSLLPGYRSLDLSTHSKPTEYARLRLLLGDYGIHDMAKWGNPVWAYLKPSSNSAIGPDMIMEVENIYGNLEKVVWEDDIETCRVNLLPVFKEASSQAQLYAIIKYYFLLAAEASYHGFEHHFIPIDQTFVHNLKAVCEEWGTRLSSPGESDICVYEDEVQSPQRRPKTPEHRGRPGYADRAGMARAVSRSSSNYEDYDDALASEEETEFDEPKSRRHQSVGAGSLARRATRASMTKSANAFDDDNDEVVSELSNTSKKAGRLMRRTVPSETNSSSFRGGSTIVLGSAQSEVLGVAARSSSGRPMHEDEASQTDTASNGSEKENNAPDESLHEVVCEHMHRSLLQDGFPDRPLNALSRRPLSTLADHPSDPSKQRKTAIRKIKKKVAEAQRQTNHSVAAITHLLHMLQDAVAENSRRMDYIRDMLNELAEQQQQSESSAEEPSEEDSEST